MKILVTGGAGFIGSHFVRLLMRSKPIERVINLDKLTYAGHLDHLKDLGKDRRYTFVRGDICDGKVVDRYMKQVDAVVHLAAETHVDRSIHEAAPFLQTNVIGTQILLESARQNKVKRFLYVSTDEVYGDITRGWAAEDWLLHPSSPYSASKAAGDHLVLSYLRTFGLPVLITRAANNYGPFQYPEKFLPLFITRGMAGQPLPLYGDGKQVRDWLHVSDHCEAIWRVLSRGKIGSVYNIGTGKGYTNIDVSKRLLKILGRPVSLIQSVKDRLGHDRRYAMSVQKIRRELGWKPTISFETGLSELIQWYQDNRSWWESIVKGQASYAHFVKKNYEDSSHRR